MNMTKKELFVVLLIMVGAVILCIGIMLFFSYTCEIPFRQVVKEMGQSMVFVFWLISMIGSCLYLFRKKK